MVEAIDLGPANPRISPLIKANKATRTRSCVQRARMKAVKANKEEMDKLAMEFR